MGSWGQGSVIAEPRPASVRPERDALPQPALGSSSLWRRLITPSFSDFYFFSLLLWLFMFGSYGWISLLGDGDTGWHIRTGEYILDHGSVPRHDLFSFSKPGAQWFAWEWLADVQFALLYRLAGLKGVVLFSGVIIALLGTVMLRHMLWRRVNTGVALGVSLLGVGAASLHYLARPHIFTLLLLACSLWIIDRDRVRPSGQVWLLVPLVALWTNLHGGFLALIACLGLKLAGGVIAAFAPGAGGDAWRLVRRDALLTAACAAASVVNPYGLELHVHITRYLRSDWIRNVVQEFQSPSFRSENMLHFEALLLLGLIAVGVVLAGRKPRDEAAFTGALSTLAWGHLALGSARHVTIFVVVALPAIAQCLSRWWEAWTADASRGSLRGILATLTADLEPNFRRTSAWPALLVAALAVVGAPLSWPQDFPAARFPVALVRANQDLLAGGRVFTTDQWADYLIFVSYPRQKVFIDGRSDFYGEPIGDQYVHLLSAQHDWEQILVRNQFDAVLSPVEWPLAALLKRQPEWRVVADDGKAILFTRSRNAPVIARASGEIRGAGTQPPAVPKNPRGH